MPSLAAARLSPYWPDELSIMIVAPASRRSSRDAARDLEAVHLRHVRVEQHQRERLALRALRVSERAQRRARRCRRPSAASSSGPADRAARGGSPRCRRRPAPADRSGRPRAGSGARVADARAATVKWNVLPSSGALSSQMRPPISSTSVDEIARPRPVPPNRRVVEPSACLNGSKIACCLSAGCRCRCR